MKLIERISNLDRRIIFVLIFFSVALPVILKLTFPEYATKMTQDVFDYIESLPAGSRTLVSLDYDPASEPELGPMTTAIIRHSVIKGHKLAFMTLWPLGQQQTKNLIENFVKVEFPQLQYGVDFVDFGFKAGYQGVITVLVTSFEKLFPTDMSGTPISDIPIMKGITSLKDFDAIINMSAGWPGVKEWVQFGTDPINKKLIAGATAVNTPLFLPYYPKQLAGMLGGIKGAAEYESLLSKKYEKYSDPKLHVGIVRWGPQTVAHIVIVALIVLGNIFYFIEKRSKKRV